MALYLGNNAMGDKGIAALADGLRHARGLQKLHVNDNEVRDVPSPLCSASKLFVGFIDLPILPDVGSHRIYTFVTYLRPISSAKYTHAPR